MSDNTPLWHVPDSTALHWRRWGDEFVVYNAASGQTHYLNMFAATVLQYFERQSASLERLIADTDIGAAEDAARPVQVQLRELVKELDSVGLIAPVVP